VVRHSKLFPTAVVAVIALSLVLALAPLPEAAVVSTGITSTSSSALSFGIQRKIVYDGSKWWLFVWDGSYLSYYYSTDLSTWTRSGTVWSYAPYDRAGGADVRISGSTVYIAQAYYSGNYYIYFIKGTISGTTIMWGSIKTVATSANVINGGGIGVGTDGKLWIVYDSVGYIYASYSADGGSTWTGTTVGSTTSSFTTGGNIIVPLSNGKMMVINKNSNNNLLFSIWGGSSWSTPTQFASGVANGWGYFSATSNGDVVYLAYVDSSGNIKFMKYTGTSWTSATTIATASTTSHPVVEYDYVKNIIYVFWVNSGTIYVAYSTDGGTTWTTTSAGNDTSITANNAVSGAVQVYNGLAVLAYLTSSASPYTVKLAIFSTTSPPSPTLQSPANGWRVNPGVNVNFMWVFNPAFSGDYQTAYQLQIASDPSFATIVVDTGKVSSGNTRVVVSVPTDVGTYYWRVMVWNSAGVASPWSSAWTIIVDKIIVTLSANTSRTDVGRGVSVSWVLRFKSDSTSISAFTITVARNGTSVYSGSASSFVDSYTAVSATVYTVSSVKDNMYGVTAFESNSVSVVWDTVVIKSIAPAKPRTTVGEVPQITVSAIYAYDKSAFQGSVNTNATAVSNVGVYTIVVTSIKDSLYGLRTFTGNTTVSVIFDRLEIYSYVITAVGSPVGNGTRVDYTLPLTITAVLKHAYDGTPLTGSNAVRVELAGVSASWDGSSWRATVPAPNVVVLKDYSVVSYAESTLGVKLVGSPIYRVIYDAIRVVARLDQVHGTVTFTNLFMYDSSPVPSGRAYVRDAGAVVSLSVSGGLATYTYNPFRNGTVEFVNMSSGLVFSNPVKPGVVVVRSVSPDGLFAVTSTTTAVLKSYLRMEGLIKAVAEAKGNVTLHHSGSLKPAAVFVNNNPAPYTYVDGVVFLKGLSSVVEAWYSVITGAQTFPGAVPKGAVYEIGFADNATLPNATLRVGLLMNGSVVTPFLRYGRNVYYGPNTTGLGYPLDVGLTWSCSNGVYEIDYMMGFMLGGSTYYKVGRHVFQNKFVACSSYLYPYLAVLGNSTGVVDKYGAVVSEVLRYWSVGAFKVTVAGKIPAGSMVRYLVLNSPTSITYTYSGIQIAPSSSTVPVTLVGFRGFTLSYSVAGVSVSNVIVTKNEYPLEFPYGVALMVVADPSARTVSIIQVAAIQSPMQVGVTTTAPGLYVPSPPAPTAPSWSIDFGAPAFIVLYGSMVAVAIVATRITGSIPRGIMMSAVAFGLVMTGMGVFTRNLTTIATAMLAFIIASSIEIARRHAT